MLTATLDVDASADAVRLELTVRNDGSEPVSLTFSDSQRADFAVRPADGDDAVWRWGEGQLFAQMLGTEELAPGDSVTYDVEWPDPDPGSYVAVGELSDDAGSASAEAEFTV
jgi:hypothetical protein